MLICLAALLIFAPATAVNAKMNSSYTVGNQSITREIVLDHGRITTKAIGRPDHMLPASGGDEFVVTLGDGKRLTAADFDVTKIEPTGADPIASLKATLKNKATGLLAEITYYAKPKDFYMRKRIRFENAGKRPIQILDVQVESLRFTSAKAIEVGKPVYADSELFLGLEFPLGHNDEKGGLVTLEHYPGKTLQPGESLIAKIAVVGAASKGEKVEAAFDRYVRRIALRKPEVMTVYGNWAMYDYLSDNVFPDEKMVLRSVDELADLRQAGWQPDYYVMDAGWFDTSGDYTQYVKSRWPDGPKPMVEAIQGVGIDYALWFDTGGGIEKNPAMEPSKYSSGRLCLASEPYISTFKNALISQINNNGLKMVKFDFATFTCDNDKHGHLLGKYAEEATLTSFLDMIDSVRQQFPDTKYIIFNGFHRSPWWLTHIDTIYTNDPAPGDRPTLHLRDSINRNTDSRVFEHRFKHMLPWYCIDDCGCMIGHMGTIYWNGAEEFRKTWVLNIGRGGMMPFVYGDLSLLDHSDRQFLVKMWNLVRNNPKVFANTQSIIGRPNGTEVYGYSHFDGSHGFLFVNNPTFERKAVTIKLDESIGLRTGAAVRVSELFPVECEYVSGDLTIELAPFEVRALEVKPGKSAKDVVPPRRAAFTSVALPVTLVKQEPSWISDPLLTMANQELKYLAGVTTRKLDAITLDRPAVEKVPGVYSFSIQLPTFDKPRTLALPFRFLSGDDLSFYPDPTNHVLAIASTDAGQVNLNTTPEYGRPIWSQCSWVTFHAELDPSLSGKKLDFAAFAMNMEQPRLSLDKAYLMDE
jgi:hypothetical protein